METRNTKAMLDYRLNVKGVYGRNRKVKFQSVRLALVPPDAPKAVNDLVELADAKLREIRVKSALIRIEEQPIEVTEYDYEGRTITTETYAIFSGRTLYKRTI